ncbi:hypothetical protein DHEL01_v205623 [Diaporthe helianthi]|uniref:Uncharacterized protein n=1 Tax=Diaporthe helianthi TaxID=158607 RepID=A0A2P5I0L5_DIAHE|nr:hypothetical protein DHEL01_v205623 [Diaporthe helianthi]
MLANAEPPGSDKLPVAVPTAHLGTDNCCLDDTGHPGHTAVALSASASSMIALQENGAGPELCRGRVTTTATLPPCHPATLPAACHRDSGAILPAFPVSYQGHAGATCLMQARGGRGRWLQSTSAQAQAQAPWHPGTLAPWHPVLFTKRYSSLSGLSVQAPSTRECRGNRPRGRTSTPRPSNSIKGVAPQLDYVRGVTKQIRHKRGQRTLLYLTDISPR